MRARIYHIGSDGIVVPTDDAWCYETLRWLMFMLLIVLLQLQEHRMHRLVRQMDLRCPQPTVTLPYWR